MTVARRSCQRNGNRYNWTMSVIGQASAPNFHEAAALMIATHLPRHLQDALLSLPERAEWRLPENVQRQLFAMTALRFLPDMTVSLVRLVDDVWMLTVLGGRVNAHVLKQRQARRLKRRQERDGLCGHQEEAAASEQPGAE